MEQPETPERAQLPDPKGALPIPAHFRLPFNGKMETPTAVPSPTQRRYHIDTVKRRRRRRMILGALAAVEIAILIVNVYLRSTPAVFAATAGGGAALLSSVGYLLLAGPKGS
jgi:hypothetical protein